jgi:hypothetical protein
LTAGRFFFAVRVQIELFELSWMPSMTTPQPLPPQRGQTILQRLMLLAVIGIVVSVIFHYLR